MAKLNNKKKWFDKSIISESKKGNYQFENHKMCFFLHGNFNDE